MIAKIVKVENTMIKLLVCQIVNLIATLDHTSHLTKLHVSFVRKVSGKIKMDNQIVKIVAKENTMIKWNAQQRLIAKIVDLESTTTKQQRMIAKIVEPVNTMIKHNAQ